MTYRDYEQCEPVSNFLRLCELNKYVSNELYERGNEEDLETPSKPASNIDIFVHVSLVFLWEVFKVTFITCHAAEWIRIEMECKIAIDD